MNASSEPRRVIVGVDGSEHSIRALEWAIGEATLRRIELHIVACWRFPAAMGVIPVATAAWDEEIFEESARSVLRDTAAKARLGESSNLVWSEEVRCGSPAGILLDESEHAEMIVVGSRGRGGFAGLLLGSVSQQVACHGRCPVVIVH